MTEFSFKKEERLTGKILINKLFTEGKVINCHPLKLVFLFCEFETNYPAQILISVPKRNFKKAVDRNLLKRRIREAYRLNKKELYLKLSQKNKRVIFAVIYTAEEINDYNLIEKRLLELLKIFDNRL